jgi:hypothetical protein
VASGIQTHLRLTVGPLPRPTAWPEVLDYEREERGGRAFMGGRMVLSRGPGVRPLPLELVPVLAEVDLASEEAVLGFVRSFGVLGAWRQEFAPVMLWPVELPLGTIPFEVPGTDVGALLAARKKYALLGTDQSGEFVDEFRIGASAVVALLAIQQELEARSFSPRRLARRWPPCAPWDAPPTKEAAWLVLVRAINAGLSSASLQLAWVRGDRIASDNERGFRAGPPIAFVPSAPDTLYGVCVLELADHILSGLHYRICANETCRRLFSVQQGRSRHGGHRTDTLKFHTRACGNAQAAREYRRRQKAGRRTK